MAPILEEPRRRRCEQRFEVRRPISGNAAPEDVVVGPLHHRDGVDLDVAEMLHRALHRVRAVRAGAAERRLAIEALRAQDEAASLGGGEAERLLGETGAGHAAGYRPGARLGATGVRAREGAAPARVC